MARLFISHSSADNAAALALRDWLAEHGYDDVFLDIDPEHGLVAGQRWQEALKAAADRCEAVLFLVSPSWLNSRWCLAEFLLAKSLHKRIFGLIVAPVPLDQVPAEMTAEWQLCELVGEDRCRLFDVELLGRPAQVAFREAGLDLLRRGLEKAGLDARSFAWPPRQEPQRAPYRGLKALEPEDAAIFFGRDAWIVRGLDAVRGLAERGVERMLVVLGASGSGKSSFLRAGLWPRLLRDDLNFLPLPVVRPQTAVISGSSGLAAALAGAFARLGETRSQGRLRDALGEGSAALRGLFGELVVLAKRRHVALAEPPGDPFIALPLDQAEELFNPDGAAEAEPFLDLLAGLLAPAAGGVASRFLLIATLRSDRLELVQNEQRLEMAQPVLFDLPPIPPAEFKSVIEGPARRVADAGDRLVIDPALTERLIGDAQGADALPLLGFTLERLYADYGLEGRLTLAEYERLGGVQGSIEAAVAAALAEPGRAPAIPAEREAQYAALRAAFIPWLARIDAESGAPMRRVAARSEIPEGSRAIVDRLVEARLLVADRRGGADVIEVAHESLLRQWVPLTAWLDGEAANLTALQGVERAAAEWDRNHQSETWLDHRGERLQGAVLLLSRSDFRARLNPHAIKYLSACLTRETTEIRDKQTRQAMQAAAEIQKWMLPEPLSDSEAKHRFDLHAEMQPAGEIDGDFYDHFLIDQDRLAFTVADVSGKGIPAALFMAVSRTLMRSMTDGRDVATGMAETNRQLATRNSNGMFVTAFHGVLDLTTGLLRYCNAGHDNPYLLRSGGERETLASIGPPLGVVSNFPYSAAETVLSEGDVLFLFSDGITEARSPDGEKFGNTRLEASLDSGRHASVAALVASVLDATHRFTAKAEQSDDITCMALVFRP